MMGICPKHIETSLTGLPVPIWDNLSIKISVSSGLQTTENKEPWVYGDINKSVNKLKFNEEWNN